MSTYYSDDTLTLLLGKNTERMRELEADSINCVVTSPPYFGLRDYDGHPDQIGCEDSPAEYVASLVEVFAEVRRVLADDGTLWLNLGDSYYSGRGNPGPNSGDQKQPARRGWTRALDRPGQKWAKPKDLLGIPWRAALALQGAGWWLRNAIVWHKPNATPDPAADRCGTSCEQVFLLTKSRRYWFNRDALRSYDRDMWSIPVSSFPGAHFATFPVELPRRCIAAGCKPGGTVLDPFSGAGTTVLAAQQLGHPAIGIDIGASYHDMTLRRMSDAPLPLLPGGVV